MTGTTEEQRLLRTWLVAHYHRVTGAGAPGRPSPSPPERSTLRAVAVLRDLDLTALLHGTLAFAVAVPDELAGPWYGAFTRTLFLAGNPASLVHRVRFLHRTEDAMMAWTAPVHPERDPARQLSRMLKLFHGPVVWPGERRRITLQVPGAGRDGRSALLRVATARVSAAEYLIHLNHVLCESVLSGLLRPGDRLAIDHPAELDPRDVDVALGPAPRAPAHFRIAQDPHRPGALRLYAHLAVTEQTGE
ncbi:MULTISPECIES: DUF6182 family protein [Micromonospora]|uniref:DUF6182 family protein n=1 Tax=Micromonospora TaxID=1873 RepID=UPI0021C8154C|nr:DUF6182 family protein [Micromonospora sp. Mcm103]